MKLKQVFKLSFAVFLIFILVSCNDNDDYVQGAASKDAQIYGFRLSAKAVNNADSVNYPILAKTKFAIDQFRDLIYNPDSLPYQTTLTKFLASIDFGVAGVSKVELIYPKDSVVEWASTSDSIDFSIPLYPKIRTYAPNPNDQKIYTIDIRVHKVNPDLLVWNDVSDLLNQPTSLMRQKTLLKETIVIEGEESVKKDFFYTFSINSFNQLYLYKAERGEAYDSGEPMTGLPAPADVKLDNITLFNGKFYLVDINKKGYSSEDGVAWTEEGTGIHSIVGVLPEGKAEKDSLLVITQNGGEYSFSKTADLNELKTVRAFNNLEAKDFPVSGFSAITNFDRTNLNKNLLILTGGENIDGKSGRLTWLIQTSNNNDLRLTSNQEHSVFPVVSGMVNFMYDDYLYALVANKLYKSASFGYKWINVPDSEKLDSNIPKASNQSVIVDSDNYIWIFGGIPESGDPINKVWRGRLNKLNPKR